MNMMVAEQLAQTLGIPRFSTPFFLPEYPEGEWGDWRISRMPIGIDYGYYSRQWIISDLPVLLRRSSLNPELWETWMSLTPHEIESQEPGCLHATGHTVIMGLGMGWIALNVALNPNVTRVTVVERDVEVIGLFAATGVMGQLPPGIAAKIVIAQADALEWQPQEPVDFLFADIWRPIADPNSLVHVQRMQSHVLAKQVYFWGQELWLYTAFQRLFGLDAPLTMAGIEQCAATELELPLALPWGDGYLERLAAVVRNRFDRGLPLKEVNPTP